MTRAAAGISPLGVNVMTSSHGGHSPETIAELCVDKLIHVSETAPPEVAVQARAFRQQILETVTQYVKVAIKEDRATVASHLERSGMSDAAHQIRRL